MTPPLCLGRGGNANIHKPSFVLGRLTLESVTVCQKDSDLKEVWTSLLGPVDERLCCQPAV